MKLKKTLLFLCVIIFCNHLFAQIEHNTTGILGLGYKIDAAGPMVESVLPGSPAFVAGVQKDDRLLKINDQSLAGITLEALTEKFKIKLGTSIKISVEHTDKTQQDVVLKKATFFSASYKVFRYMIFFDENNKPVYKPDQPCIWGDDCYNGYGYYAYSATEAFCGEFENGNRKEGLYYYVEKGKPFYYLGAFSNNKYTGMGTLTYLNDKNEELNYIGDFVNGSFEGNGYITYMKDLHTFAGSFKAGLREGYGKEKATDGTIIAEGKWRKGVYLDPASSENTETESTVDFPVGANVSVSDFLELNKSCPQSFSDRPESVSGEVVESDLVKDENGKYSGCVKQWGTKHCFKGARVEKLD